MANDGERPDPGEDDLVGLVGVYHANGSLRGEVAYVVGKLLGRSHCALCDITHGMLRRKSSFDACAASFDVPFDLVHLDERSPEVRAASEDASPCVLGHFANGGLEVLVGRDELEACDGDPEALAAAIRTAVIERGRGGPPPPGAPASHDR